MAPLPCSPPSVYCPLELLKFSLVVYPPLMEISVSGGKTLQDTGLVDGVCGLSLLCMTKGP